ncbi:MAG: hypothetical protein JWQ75_977, partial [Pseudarthrobacter sp.]|nr:hypothetical protein [Pseudarthrobacter sp.]
YVDAQWLEEFDARLADYRASLDGSPGAGSQTPGVPEDPDRQRTAADATVVDTEEEPA